jgi:plasmid stability protein
MRNVTITMDEDVARWVRIEAAKHDVSVSRFVGEALRERMQAAVVYEEAMRAFLAAEPLGRSDGARLPARDEIYDRPVLRR